MNAAAAVEQGGAKVNARAMAEAIKLRTELSTADETRRSEILKTLVELKRLETVEWRAQRPFDQALINYIDSIFTEDAQQQRQKYDAIDRAGRQADREKQVALERARPADWKRDDNAVRAQHLIRLKYSGQLGAGLAELARLLSTNTSGTPVPDSYKPVNLGTP